jgi:hypothetical protein
MKREKFCTALKDNFMRCHFPQQLLNELTGHCTRLVNSRCVRAADSWFLRLRRQMALATRTRAASGCATQTRRLHNKTHLHRCSGAHARPLRHSSAAGGFELLPRPPCGRSTWRGRTSVRICCAPTPVCVPALPIGAR